MEVGHVKNHRLLTNSIRVVIGLGLALLVGVAGCTDDEGPSDPTATLAPVSPDVYEGATDKAWIALDPETGQTLIPSSNYTLPEGARIINGMIVVSLSEDADTASALTVGLTNFPSGRYTIEVLCLKQVSAEDVDDGASYQILGFGSATDISATDGNIIIPIKGPAQDEDGDWVLANSDVRQDCWPEDRNRGFDPPMCPLDIPDKEPDAGSPDVSGDTDDDTVDGTSDSEVGPSDADDTDDGSVSDTDDGSVSDTDDGSETDVPCDLAESDCCLVDNDCGDDDLCTDDVCDVGTGTCSNPPTAVAASCDDDNVCNGTESCDSETGSCDPGMDLVCNDGNDCTSDSCNALDGCQYAPIADCCLVDNDCGDDDLCTDDVCDVGTGTCSNPPTAVAASCDDDNVCNGTESCDSETGSCDPGMDLVCNDGNDCTSDSCNALDGCQYAPIADCCLVDNDCNDGNSCTDDVCDTVESICLALPNTDPCDDGVACTEGDTCAASECVPGTPLADCCDVDADCDDGNICNGTEMCNGGTCSDGEDLECDDGGNCNGTETCDPTEGCLAGVPLGGCCGTDGCLLDVSSQNVIVETLEFTVMEYEDCVNAGTVNPPGTGTDCNWEIVGYESHPINCVSQFDLKACAVSLGARLPTTEEWEMAAHGGTGSTYPWGETALTCDLAVFDDGGGSGCGTGGTLPVGSKPDGMSPLGHLDMIGNVMEHTDDDSCGGTIEFDVRGGAWSTSNVDKLTIIAQDCRDDGWANKKAGGRLAWDGPAL